VKYPDIKSLDIQGKAEIATKVKDAVKKGRYILASFNMVMLPKANKDHTTLNGYRIITMANVWIKISEKVVIKWLNRLVKSKNMYIINLLSTCIGLYFTLIPSSSTTLWCLE
jgi:hypothetical protein